MQLSEMREAEDAYDDQQNIESGPDIFCGNGVKKRQRQEYHGRWRRMRNESTDLMHDPVAVHFHLKPGEILIGARERRAFSHQTGSGVIVRKIAAGVVEAWQNGELEDKKREEKENATQQSDKNAVRKRVAHSVEI